MNGWRDGYILIFVLLCVAVLFGLQRYDLHKNYIRKEEVKQMIYDILATRQNRDDQILFSQVQKCCAEVIEHHPDAYENLKPYQDYWNLHALELFSRWSSEK
jgi:hypothetical protein